jgi:hypothetical protein
MSTYEQNRDNVGGRSRKYQSKAQRGEQQQRKTNGAGAHLPSLPLIFFRDIKLVLDALDFVEGLLTTSGLSVVYGEPGSGKTFWVLDLCLHVASGRTWHDREVDRGAVVYCALEGGPGIRNRFAAARKRMNLPDDTPLALIQVPIDLRQPDADTAALIQAIQQVAQESNMPVRLVVIDTLFRALAGGNENGPEDMGALVTNADRIRNVTGAHVLFIHHCGKEAARGMRGHSSLKAATDTEIEVTRSLDGTSVARVTRQRDLEIEGEFAFKLASVKLGINRRGKPVSSGVVETIQTTATKGVPEVKLGTEATLAFHALCDVLAAPGAEPLPYAMGQPNGIRGAPRLIWWREFCSRSTGAPDPADPPEERERKKRLLESRFNRATARLTELKRVGFRDGWAWLPGSQPQ